MYINVDVSSIAIGIYSNVEGSQQRNKTYCGGWGSISTNGTVTSESNAVSKRLRLVESTYVSVNEFDEGFRFLRIHEIEGRARQVLGKDIDSGYSLISLRDNTLFVNYYLPGLYNQQESTFGLWSNLCKLCLSAPRTKIRFSAMMLLFRPPHIDRLEMTETEFLSGLPYFSIDNLGIAVLGDNAEETTAK